MDKLTIYWKKKPTRNDNIFRKLILWIVPVSKANFIEVYYYHYYYYIWLIGSTIDLLVFCGSEIII